MNDSNIATFTVVGIVTDDTNTTVPFHVAIITDSAKKAVEHAIKRNPTLQFAGVFAGNLLPIEIDLDTHS
jgi:hypothetical protein